jgi:hypothetical protein
MKLDEYYHGVGDDEFEYRKLRDYVEAKFDASNPQDLTIVRSRRKTRKESEINSLGIAQSAAEAAWEEWSGPDGGGRCDASDDFDEHELEGRIAREIEKYVKTLDIYQCVEVERYVLTAEECKTILRNI